MDYLDNLIRSVYNTINNHTPVYYELKSYFLQIASKKLYPFFDLIDFFLIGSTLFFLYVTFCMFLRSIEYLIKKTKLFRLAFNYLPFVRNKLNDEVKKMEDELYKEYDQMMIKKIYKLPENGVKLNKILEKQKEWKEKYDKKSTTGKISGCRYVDYKEFEENLKNFTKEYLYENPLHFELFIASRQMEVELISMTGYLFSTNKEHYGVTTSGGTESLIMSLYTYREWARNIIGSAPNFPFGICDNIPELAKLALNYNIGLHVDACLGGFIIPFAKQLGVDIPNFDFSVEGVTSISCDHHKYGLAIKGISMILYKTKELRQHQYFVNGNWQGGIYGTPSMAGSRSTGGIAAAWFSMMYNGHNTFLNNAKNICETTEKTTKAIKDEIPELEVLGNPKLNVVAFKEKVKWLNMYSLHNALKEKDWHLAALQNPAALHIAYTQANYKNWPDLIKSLKQCILDGGTCAIYGTTSQIPDPELLNTSISSIFNAILKN